MRLIITTLTIIVAILGLALSILPFGNITFIPIIIAFILGLIAFKMAQKEDKNTKLVKVVFLIIIVGLGMSIYRSVFDENVVVEDIETINRDKASEENAIEELEAIEIEE